MEGKVWWTSTFCGATKTGCTGTLSSSNSSSFFEVVVVAVVLVVVALTAVPGEAGKMLACGGEPDGLCPTALACRPPATSFSARIATSLSSITWSSATAASLSKSCAFCKASISAARALDAASTGFTADPSCKPLRVSSTSRFSSTPDSLKATARSATSASSQAWCIADLTA